MNIQCQEKRTKPCLLHLRIPKQLLSLTPRAPSSFPLKDASGCEYIWQRDAKYWKNAPLLFPVVGNCRNDRTILEDRIYAIEKHGFCRERDFDVSQKSPAKAVFSMDDTPDTHRAYPYAFCLSLAYELKDGILFMEYQVEKQRPARHVVCHRRTPGI